MPFSVDHLAELNLLGQFPSTSTQEGLKGQKDGGYLTPLGAEAVDLTQKLQSILSSA